jgi:hypothetical protein
LLLHAMRPLRDSVKMAGKLLYGWLIWSQHIWRWSSSASFHRKLKRLELEILELQTLPLLQMIVTLMHTSGGLLLMCPHTLAWYLKRWRLLSPSLLFTVKSVKPSGPCLTISILKWAVKMWVTLFLLCSLLILSNIPMINFVFSG